MQAVHQYPSCLAHPFRTDGNSSGLLSPCQQTDYSTGLLSGLVFYANIVGVNRTILIPVESSNILSVFIAWLNLDFRVEICFFKEMNEYSKLWLQCVFPIFG